MTLSKGINVVSISVPDPDRARVFHGETLGLGVPCEEPVLFPGCVVFAGVTDPFGNRLQMCSPAP